jgi:hypothetical protein
LVIADFSVCQAARRLDARRELANAGEDASFPTEV